MPENLPDTDEATDLPSAPIDRVVKPLVRFMHVEAASGVVLLAAALAAIVLANSPFSEPFLSFWKTPVGFSFGEFEFRHSLKHFINDGLMVVFFFVIGMEVKRELVIGELRDLRNATFPLAGAVGGMLGPALIFLALQWGQPGQRGWGIPMATDIAFVVGCLAVLGKRVPHTLRVTLLSMAIADDIGAILVIAVGYTDDISLKWLLLGLVGLGIVIGLSRVGVRSFLVYTVLALLTWFAFHESGVHATIEGVILGLMTPVRSYVSPGAFGALLRRAEGVFKGDWGSVAHRAEKVRQFKRAARETIPPLEYLESLLHPWVAFFIMPLFALANAGVPIDASAFGSRLGLAVMLGLIIGKPLGIGLFCWLAVKIGLARVPDGLRWPVVIGGSCLCGIGFTMALFIAELALGDDLLDVAKLGVVVGSVVSAVLAFAVLLTALPKRGEPAAASPGS
jgi:NhaA family Na+:H+ antiporter